jgi:murein DD-endopeptidase MepM/ murein hydrolase activator NlpD
MRVRTRLTIVGVVLAVASVLPAMLAADELPPGWGGDGGEPPPPAPPGWAPPADAPLEDQWPVPVEPQAQPLRPPSVAQLSTPALEDEEDPELTASELEIANALTPSCADPYIDGFVLLAFPQPDEDTSFDDGFGVDRPDDRRHQGIDVFGPKGAPVVAIADGVVRRTGTGITAGHYLVVDHEDGWQSKYMHLNNDTAGTDNGALPLTMALAEGIEPGVEVTTGQLLGWVGDSGNAEGTPPHTHFELWKSGHLANPYDCLDRAWVRQLRVFELSGRAL